MRVPESLDMKEELHCGRRAEDDRSQGRRDGNMADLETFFAAASLV